ncbi:cell division protein FtsA [Alphaproteobacteria bacterium]|nr:cell division protein FtsA [Alphaproteobacteria bacterium]
MIKVGIDIGNSKISCVVCDLKDNVNPRILSFTSMPTSNVNKSLFKNYEFLKKEVLTIINKAAKESQTDIKSVFLNLPLISASSEFYSSEIFLNNEKIDELHLKKALNESIFFEEVENKEIIMNYISSYQLDGNIISTSPNGNYANQLLLNFYKLSSDKNIVRTYTNLFKEINIHIAKLIPTPISSALATLNKDDLDLGSISIDLGHSNTSIALFENNKLVFCDTVNIGSKNITNDIARGISTTLESAERLKTLYGSVNSFPSDEFEIIEVPVVSSETNQFKQINRSSLNSIIKPRVEETLEIVWQKLKQYSFHKKKIKNLILTGGGSQLEGISDYAQIIFDSNVRLGRPSNIIGLDKRFNGPEFSQTIGSVLFKEEEYQVDFIKKTQKQGKKSLKNEFFDWLDKYI